MCLICVELAKNAMSAAEGRRALGIELDAHLAERAPAFGGGHRILRKLDADEAHEIGRASCRERV